MIYIFIIAIYITPTLTIPTEKSTTVRNSDLSLLFVMGFSLFDLLFYFL